MGRDIRQASLASHLLAILFGAEEFSIESTYNRIKCGAQDSIYRSTYRMHGQQQQFAREHTIRYLPMMPKRSLKHQVPYIDSNCREETIPGLAQIYSST